jgi:[acyl-carrier-protein] S-malonyltransferase
VLTGLIKKIAKDVKVYSLDSQEKLKGALDFLGGAQVE